ncbi:Peptidase A2 domain-containing protein, partial [Aphis craccivora]
MLADWSKERAPSSIQKRKNRTVIMSGISNLIKCRGQLKASVTRFLNFVTKENVDVNEIHVRKEKIEEIWSEYERIQSAIEDTEGVKMNEQDKYREEFEEMFFKAVGIAKKLTEPVVNEKEAHPYCGIDEDGTCERNYQSIETTSDIKDNSRKISRPPIRLSALNVPTFSGEYNEWATFHDIFTSLIHNNADLSPVEKFFYLRSAVTGDAQNCIRCVETTSNNYEIAWNKLNKRYSNKKVLVQTHVKSMFELEPVASESSAKLRQFTDALTGHMSALETLGHKPNNWGPLLVHLIVTKLDKNSRREWETNAPKEEVAPVEVIIEFLEARFKILEAIETCKNINIRQSAYKFNNHNKQFNERSSSLVIGNNKGCYICQAPHTIYKCPIFIALPVTERIKKVTEMKLCKLCLRQHVPKKCNGKNCFTCSKPHNTMLHLSNSSELRKSEAEKPSEDQETTSA